MGKKFIKHNRNNKKNNQNENAEKDTNKSEYTMMLKEDQVGITEYVLKSKGFSAVLKSRFNDFHVNEIDQTGEVLELKNTKIPTLVEAHVDEGGIQLLKSQLSHIITDAMWNELDNLVKSDGKFFNIDVDGRSKDDRTLIHKNLYKIYNGKVVTNTNTLNEKQVITVKPSKSGSQMRREWPFPGEYVHFIINKENMDTSEVVSILSHMLRLKPSQINYCGTKDKRAVTTQKFCIKRRYPQQIVSTFRKIKNVRVGEFTFHKNVLKLGDLKGNRFRIVLRYIDDDREEIEKSLQSVKENGFINYYGLQRFGNNATIPTYLVGVALLKKDYKGAVELILKPREQDAHFMKKIRKFWWEKRDSAAAAEMFESKNFIEKKLLDGLAEYGETEYANALRKIPRNMLLLYTHSYQSVIFNRVASRRIKEFGLKPIVGDLVYRDDVVQDINNDIVNDIPEDEAAEEVEDADNNTNSEESSFKNKVIPLTEEDISSEKYTIFDVVLPMPGFDITYPANVTAQWYEEMLAEDGLSSEKLRHNVKTYSLGGTYRKLIIKPENMSWYYTSFQSPMTDIITHNNSMQKDAQKDDTGPYQALILDCCLPPSSYATMCLRELLKIDTSPVEQAKLQKQKLKQHQDQEKTEESLNDNVEDQTKDIKKPNGNDKKPDDNDNKKPVDKTTTAEVKTATAEGATVEIDDKPVDSNPDVEVNPEGHSKRKNTNVESEPEAKKIKAD